MAESVSAVLSLTEQQEKRRERTAFLLVTVVLAPVIAVAIVGGYGLIVWLAHALGAPPGLPVG